MSRRARPASALRAVALSLCLLLESVAMAETVYHVAPTGPLTDLAAALAESRKPGLDQPRRIVLDDGVYPVLQTLSLGPQDSRLTIEAAPGAHPLLLGGKPITGWQLDGDGLWAAALPEVAAGTWDFRLLVVNGRYCPRARLPETGYFKDLNAWDVPWMSTTGGGWKRKPTPEELTTLLYRPEDLGPWLDLKNAELTVYHSWDESVVGVASMDEATHTLKLSTPCGHPPGAFHNPNYVVWNVRQGLTQPGQWYLDRTAGKVVYKPLPGEDMARAEAFAPVVPVIVRISGTDQAQAQDITLRGLRLSLTTTPLRAGGFGASAFDGAVQVSRAGGCRLERLEVFNVGGQGIKADARGVRVEHCEVHHTGAGGILARQGESVVTDNQIHDVGLTYPSAIALWGGGKDPGGSLLAHNEVHHCPYTAIACGGDDHVIEANRIHHAMQVLHDGAAIYITFCKRQTVRGNWTSDISYDGGPSQSHAYYLDEQAEDCLVESNLAVGCGSPSHNHMAKHNTLRGNVFLSDGDLYCHFPKCTEYTFEHNVLLARGAILCRGPEAVTTWLGNVLHSAAGKLEGRPLTNYNAGQPFALEPQGGSVFADPLVQVEGGKVSFGQGSPAPGLGIAALDVSGAGVRE